MTNTTYNIAQQFSTTPSGRYASRSDYSGEAFGLVLEDLLGKYETVSLVLDGVEGYPSSFLEESFGGLVRKGMDKSELIRRIKFVYEERAFAHYPAIIQRYIEQASRS